MKKLFALLMVLGMLVFAGNAMADGYYNYYGQDQDYTQFQGGVVGAVDVNIPCVGTMTFDGLAFGQFQSAYQCSYYGDSQLQQVGQSIIFQTDGMNLIMNQTGYQVQGYGYYYGVCH